MWKIAKNSPLKKIEKALPYGFNPLNMTPLKNRREYNKRKHAWKYAFCV